MGLQRLSRMRGGLFKELVREFIASIELYYTHPRAKRANEGYIRFKLINKQYNVSIFDLCDIYDFKKDSKERYGVSKQGQIEHGSDVNHKCVFAKHLPTYRKWAKDTTEPQL
ncbi:unnamed protein product [Cochlearia groenlandica]